MTKEQVEERMHYSVSDKIRRNVKRGLQSNNLSFPEVNIYLWQEVYRQVRRPVSDVLLWRVRQQLTSAL